MSSNNDKRRKRYAEKSVLKYYYVSTVADYNARLARQNGACAICKTKPDHTLCVDHCHVTREVRGLLCRGCNLGLGNYKDDPRLLRAARPFSRTRRPRPANNPIEHIRARPLAPSARSSGREDLAAPRPMPRPRERRRLANDPPVRHATRANGENAARVPE